MYKKSFFTNIFDAAILSYLEYNQNMLQEDQNSYYYLIFYNMRLETVEL